MLNGSSLLNKGDNEYSNLMFKIYVFIFIPLLYA